jgi:hypothetical protein
MPSLRQHDIQASCHSVLEQGIGKCALVREKVYSEVSIYTGLSVVADLVSRYNSIGLVLSSWDVLLEVEVGLFSHRC